MIKKNNKNWEKGKYFCGVRSYFLFSRNNYVYAFFMLCVFSWKCCEFFKPFTKIFLEWNSAFGNFLD